MCERVCVRESECVCEKVCVCVCECVCARVCEAETVNQSISARLSDSCVPRMLIADVFPLCSCIFKP